MNQEKEPTGLQETDLLVMATASLAEEVLEDLKVEDPEVKENDPE